jgi:Arc/MetJ-type ribon-helix-helix transcriptional regulator
MLGKKVRRILSLNPSRADVERELGAHGIRDCVGVKTVAVANRARARHCDNITALSDVIMVRTQIQLTEAQARRLKQLAAAQGRSMADLIRTTVDALLAQPDAHDHEARRARALRAAGRFRSGVGDLSTQHDRHLAEVLTR